MRTLTPDQQRVRNLVEVFETPIVFHPGGWEDTVPEWIKLRVIQERVDMVCNGGWDKATDAEVTCYLYTASLDAPLGSDWSEITLYQAAKQMPQIREALPDTLKELSDYQKHELGDLKRKIRDSQLRRRNTKRKEAEMPKRKLVIEEHEGSVLVGIITDNCDPVIKTVQGGLDQALAAVPEFLQQAEEKWAVTKKNPVYTPPVEPKAVKPAAGAGTGTAVKPAPVKGVAEDLPLLAGIKTEEPAVLPTEGKAEVAIGGLISKEEAIKIAEEQGGSREELEAQPEAPTTDIDAGEFAATPAEAEAEAQAETEAVGPAATAQEAESAGIIPSDPSILPMDADLVEEKAEQEVPPSSAGPTPGEALSTAPRAAATPGEWEYILQDGRGPFESVQLAMDELGLDATTRPQHNRWDRLSTPLKEKIQRRPKA